MSWKDLLAPEGKQTQVLPYAGGRQVHSLTRTWRLQGRLPAEHGWWTFEATAGRGMRLAGRDLADPDPEFAEDAGKEVLRGYLVGDRFIQDGAHVDPDPDKLIEQTEPVYCVELGLERFSRAEVLRDREGRLIYLQVLWPEGPEDEALIAFQDRKDSIAHVKGVTPALDLAFQWISWGRERAEERAREVERLRLEDEARTEAERAAAAALLDRQEKLNQALKDATTGPGLRALAAQDFDAAARAALALSGAELLDARDSRNRNEKVVQYRFRQRRLECVVDKRTLRIVDAGVCLDDHRGTKGDTYFTLESLPGVIGWAMDQNKLVVWRHVDGDPGRDYDDDYDD
jgi:hypothetical protein